MKDNLRMSETQRQLMDIFWNTPEKISSRELLKIFKYKNWKMQTINTHLTRLYRKNLIAYERVGKAYVYFPTMTHEEYRLTRMCQLINSQYNSMNEFLKILIDKNLVSKNDILELISYPNCDN